MPRNRNPTPAPGSGTDAFHSTTSEWGKYLPHIRTAVPGVSSLATIQGYLAEMAAAGGEVRFRPGTVAVSAKLNFTALSDLIVVCHPNTAFVSSLAYSDGLTNSVLYSANSILTGPVDLQAAVAEGATTIVVTDANAATLALVDGSEISISQNNASCAARHTVTGAPVSAGGNTTITLDRPTPHAWTHTGADKAQVAKVNTSARVRLYGNGALISGTGDRAIQFLVAKDCEIEDFRIVPGAGGFGGFGASFDVGGFRNKFRRIKVDGSTSVIMGVALESNEGSVIEDCYAKNIQNNPWGSGVYVFSSRGCVVRGGEFHSNPIGVQVDFLGGMAAYHPGKGCIVEGAYCHHNTVGAKVGEGSIDTQIIGGRFSQSTSHGISIVNGTVGGTTTGTKIIGAETSDNAGSGVHVAASTARTHITDITSDRNLRAGIEACGNCDVTGGRSAECGNNTAYSAGMIIGDADASSAAEVNVNGFAVTKTGAQAFNGFRINSTSRVVLSNITTDLSGGVGTKIHLVNYQTEVHTNNWIARGASDYVYYSASNANARWYKGPGHDFLTGAGAIVLGAASFASYGTKTLVAGTVTVTNPMVCANDRNKLTVRHNTLAGTPGALSVPTITDATSFVITSSSATDTSTVDWDLSG